jgi:hypothetical protein
MEIAAGQAAIVEPRWYHGRLPLSSLDERGFLCDVEEEINP